MGLEVQQARNKARELAIPDFPGISADILRAGRISDDTDADHQYLKVDTYNRAYLWRLLVDAAQAYKWNEAAGIISVLLRCISWWDKKLVDSRPFFKAAFEILRQLGETKTARYRKMFTFLYDQMPGGNKLDAKRCRVEVEFELAIFLYHSGEVEEAYDIARPIVDSLGIRNNPAVNLVYGLILHRLWYERVCEQDEGSSSDEESFQAEWQPEAAGEHDPPDASQHPGKLKTSGEASEDVTISNATELEDSTGSGERPLKRKRRYEDEDEFWKNARVNVQPVMDRRLFPVQVRYQPNVEYQVEQDDRAKTLQDNAVNYLQHAASCQPEMIAYLLPLVQLLLAAGNVERARKEMDISFLATKNVLPLSMKAMLLEALAEQDSVRLANAYEAILERDPLSKDALTGLINMFDKGEYETGKFVQTLVNALEADPGSVLPWRKLAEVLLEVSSNVDKQEGPGVSSQELALTFIKFDTSWRNRHFPIDKRSDDESASLWKLVAYKAACAAHIYGADFPFVERVGYVLRKLKKKHSVSLLASHREKALSLLG